MGAARAQTTPVLRFVNGLTNLRFVFSFRDLKFLRYTVNSPGSVSCVLGAVMSRHVNDPEHKWILHFTEARKTTPSATGFGTSH